MDSERRRMHRVAWTGAGAMALPVVFLANQSMDAWRQQEFTGLFTGTGASLELQVMGLLAEILEYFSWRWSPTDAISRLSATTSISVGSGSVAAQDVSDLAYAALAWLLLAALARSQRPRPGRVALGAAAWGASLLAAALSGLVVPQLFGVPVADTGVLVTMTGEMASRAPGGFLFGAFAALVVVAVEEAVARWSPGPAAGGPESDGATAAPPAEGGSQPAGESAARFGAGNAAVIPEPRPGDAEPQADGIGPPVGSDVEFLGDFELGEAGPPGAGR